MTVAAAGRDEAMTVGAPKNTSRPGQRCARTAVFHAYDARNEGDGLLVRESLGALDRAGLGGSVTGVVATAAETFSDLGDVMQFPALRDRGFGRFTASLRAAGDAASGITGITLISPSRRSAIGRLAGSADLVVGVGGGYLRAPGGRASQLMAAVHLPQLALAAASRARTVYLPQSIGPLRGAAGRAVRRNLRNIDVVFARDDTTVEEVDLPNVVRAPDLAVLDIARMVGSGAGWHGRRSGSSVLGIARSLSLGEGYHAKLAELGRRLPVRWVVHSSARGQDDGDFYEQVGLRSSGPSLPALRSADAGVVVSVRLHGALQAIRAGVPAIHLSYERKGWGAFADLGIEGYVHDVRRFDVDAVVEQAAGLLDDPGGYWRSVEDRLSALLGQEQGILDALGGGDRR